MFQYHIYLGAHHFEHLIRFSDVVITQVFMSIEICDDADLQRS